MHFEHQGQTPAILVPDDGIDIFVINEAIRRTDVDAQYDTSNVRIGQPVSEHLSQIALGGISKIGWDAHYSHSKLPPMPILHPNMSPDELNGAKQIAYYLLTNEILADPA